MHAYNTMYTITQKVQGIENEVQKGEESLEKVIELFSSSSSF